LSPVGGNDKDGKVMKQPPKESSDRERVSKISWGVFLRSAETNQIAVNYTSGEQMTSKASLEDIHGHNSMGMNWTISTESPKMNTCRGEVISVSFDKDIRIYMPICE